MRIAILINSLEVGGAQRMALRLLEALDDAGYPVWFVTADGTRDMPLHTRPDRAAALEARLVRLSEIDADSPTLRKIAAAPLQYLRLERFLRRAGIEVLVSFEDRANILNMLTLARTRRILAVRHPMVSLGTLKSPLKRFLIDTFFSLFSRRAAAINFNSVEAMQEFQRRYPVPPERLSTIPNFCDHDHLLHDAAQFPIPPEFAAFTSHPYLLACGRLRPVKGFAHLIRLFGRVHQADPTARLVILGDGPLMGELASLADALGLAGAVLFPGFQKHTAAWIANARLFVLTSLSEGFPNVMLEALALRAPVVSTDCISGPREILSPGGDCTRKTQAIDYAPFGVLTPPLSGLALPPETGLDPAETAMADAIVRLLADHPLREALREQGYQRSLDFSAANQRQRWFELIEG